MFKEIIGQHNAVNILSNAIKHDKVAQAYIFYGPSGSGKLFTAFNFAKALNCLKRLKSSDRNYTPQNQEKLELPCNECISCKKIDTFNHPDVKLVFPIPNYSMDETGVVKSNQEFLEIQSYINNKIKSPWQDYHFEKATAIRIDQIRHLQKDVSMSSHEGRKKIFIFEHFETLTTSACNAFLKTLEEPPVNTHFIMTVNSISNLLPTIISRCQKVEFHSLSSDLIEKHLINNLFIEPVKARLFARLSNGNFKKALNLSNDENLETMNVTIEFLQIVLSGNDYEFINWIDKHFAKNSKNSNLFKNFIEYLNLWISDLQMFNLSQDKLIYINQIALIGRFYSKNPLLLECLPALQLKIDECLSKFQGNVNIKLILNQVYISFKQTF